MLDNDDHLDTLGNTALGGEEHIDEEEWSKLPPTRFQAENAAFEPLQLIPDPSLTSFEVCSSHTLRLLRALTYAMP